LNLEDVEQILRECLNALGPAPRAAPRADAYYDWACNREYWAHPKTRTFAELLIDAEDSREVGAVLVRC
jgi:hypothetical protein